MLYILKQLTIIGKVLLHYFNTANVLLGFCLGFGLCLFANIYGFGRGWHFFSIHSGIDTNGVTVHSLGFSSVLVSVSIMLTGKKHNSVCVSCAKLNDNCGSAIQNADKQCTVLSGSTALSSFLAPSNPYRIMGSLIIIRENDLTPYRSNYRGIICSLKRAWRRKKLVFPPSCTVVTFDRTKCLLSFLRHGSLRDP